MLARINKLRRWWRVWLILSVCWMVGATSWVDWRGSNLVTVHTEPYIIHYAQQWGFVEGRQLTSQEYASQQQEVNASNEASLKRALDEGYKKAHCWGTMLVSGADDDNNSSPAVVFNCFSKAEDLKRYAWNGLVIVSVPILLPLSLMGAIFLFGWVRSGFTDDATL